MQTGLRITFRDMDPSDAIDSYVRTRAAKLDKLFARITSCHVTIGMPHGHHHGSHPTVRIELAVPGKELVVSHDHDNDKGLRDMHARIDAAFQDARRLLVNHLRSQRADRHAGSALARSSVARR